MGLKLVKTNVLYRGFHTYEERLYETDEGNTFSREVLVSSDAVASMVYHKEKEMYGFVKQFRAGANKHMLECPAGIIDEGEAVVEAVRREIREELGCEVVSPHYLTTVEQGPATVAGKLHLFYTEVTGEFEQELDDDEDVEIVWLTKVEFENITFRDMKTIILLSIYNQD